MLTHEELMEKCQEIDQAIDETMETIDAMLDNNGICKPDQDAINPTLDMLFDREESLLTAYIENRNSISDEDAKEIIMSIASAYCAIGFTIGSLCIENNTPDSLMTNSN